MGMQLRSSAHHYAAAQLCTSLWRCTELLIGMWPGIRSQVWRLLPELQLMES